MLSVAVLMIQPSGCRRVAWNGLRAVFDVVADCDDFGVSVKPCLRMRSGVDRTDKRSYNRPRVTDGKTSFFC
jgi:hypothetical protein